MAKSYNVGDVVTCAETGKAFTVASAGCSFNYATNDVGEVFSDEGVDIRERRALLDRTRPFTGYLSSDCKSFTGWKGNVLGTVVISSQHRGNFGNTVLVVTVRDVHGRFWHGRGEGGGMCITLRPSKG